MSGWIKLHRSMLDWEWYEDHNATRLLIHLLISVNHEDKKWKGHTIKAGSLAFSWDTLSEKIGLSIQEIRTAMKKLESSQEVTRQVTNRYQVVSLVKWEKLQETKEQLTGKLTINQQASNNQLTTTKEDKEVKKNSIESRAKDFYEQCASFQGAYSKDMLRAFYDYWTEPNKSKSKMRFEQQTTWELSRRLKTWASKEYNQAKPKPNTSNKTMADIILGRVSND